MGRARRAAARSRADVGLAAGCPAGSSGLTGSSADVGIAGAFRPGRSARHRRAELGRPRAGFAVAAPCSRSTSARPGVGWSRASSRVGLTDPGRAAATRSSTTRARSTSAGARSRPQPSSRRAFVGRAFSRPGPGVGCTGELAPVPHPDSTFLEPARPGLERAGAGCIDTGCPAIRRLGCTAPRAGGAASDSCTVVERPGARGLGRAED